MADVTLNNIFLVNCMILGVVLSLWVGIRYVIMTHRSVRELIEKVKIMEARELEILERKKKRKR